MIQDVLTIRAAARDEGAGRVRRAVPHARG